MMLGSSPTVTDGMLARGGFAARPSLQSTVSPPAARGFHVLSSSPSENGGGFGGTPGSHSHSGSFKNRPRLGSGLTSASPVLSPTVTGFNLEASSSIGSGVSTRVATKVSALRLSPGAAASETARASSATTSAVATTANDQGVTQKQTLQAPASPGGLTRGLSAMRDALEAAAESPSVSPTASKPPLYGKSPTKSLERGSTRFDESVDDTVEYYSTRLAPLPDLTSEVRQVFDTAYAMHPSAFGDDEAFDAFHLCASALKGMDANVLTRSITTASTLAELGMRSDVIAASILHSALDAGVVDEREARARCGAEVTAMAKDAARLSRISDLSRASAGEAPLSDDERQKFRAMLIAMTDARVVVMKLAERVVELEDSDYFSKLSSEAQTQITDETLATYVPLASRLGTWSLKARLEDARFARVSPTTHEELKQELERDGRRASVSAAVGDIKNALQNSNVASEKVYGRPKSVFGVYRKMQEKGRKDLRDVHDVRAVRVIVNDERACYEALDAVLATKGYSEVAGRTKDYVQHAKCNGYRSLHCVVVDAHGQSCEVQIRTPEMHQAAEYGIASHWRYKEGTATPNAHAIDEQVKWARFALSWQGRLAYDLEKERKRGQFVADGASMDDDELNSLNSHELCQVVPCPCPFPAHASDCRNHEDNLSFGAGGAHVAEGFDYNLVSADSASFGSQPMDGLMGMTRIESDVYKGHTHTSHSNLVTIVAVVDGRMRVVDVPRGSRLSDIDVLSLGDKNDPRAADFFTVKSIVVNREPVPHGAEVAVTLRTGDLIEVARENLNGNGSPRENVAAFGAAAAEEQRRRQWASDVTLVSANNVISRNGFAP